MNKQIYIPSKEELLQMQAYKANIYKYLLVKAAEKLISENIMLNSIDESLKCIEELTDIFCYLYPQEMSFSKTAKHNKALCLRTIKKKNPSDSALDTLYYFDDDILDDYLVSLEVIELLHKHLQYSQEYRFSYRDNSLLNDIFLVNHERFMKCPDKTINMLIEIEPAYALKLPNNTLVEDGNRLKVAIDEYTYRYGVPYITGREYFDQDILSNPDEKTKKLLKCLYH